MRTNIIIDDELMSAAMAAGGFTTKKDAVEEGLRLLARRAVYDRILALRGKVNWSLDGDWTQDAKADKADKAVVVPVDDGAPVRRAARGVRRATSRPLTSPSLI